MPVKKSIRIKTRQPRRAAETHSAKPADAAAWWTRTPVIAGSGMAFCAVVLMIAVVSPSRDTGGQKPPAPTSAHEDNTATAPVPDAGAPLEKAASVRSGAADVQQPPDSEPAVTLTGCLERSEDAFRLTDTDGTRVPRSRSWKSAFLKKRSAPIAVIDPVKRLNLAGHVGQPVSVTGKLVGREMRVGALRRIESSCSAPKVKA